MDKRTTLNRLDSLSTEDRFPIWIISYSRAGEAPTLDWIQREWNRTEDVNVVVRSTQEIAYREAYPRLQIHGEPDSEVSGVGYARWRAAEMAHEAGHEYILMLDDDITQINHLVQGYTSSGQNAGREVSRNLLVEDFEGAPERREKILTAASETSRQVFESHSKSMLGGLIKRHMSFDYKNHRTQYSLNSGVTPRQVYVWALGRMWDNDIQLNLNRFGKHGDDIGLTAEVLQAGFDCFAMPSFTYDHWPEDINIHRSVIRNESDSLSLHQKEWEDLQAYEIRLYLREKKHKILGTYQWGDVDWRALNSLRGTRLSRVGWPGEPGPEDPVESLL